jgi:hypothetical protein
MGSASGNCTGLRILVNAADPILIVQMWPGGEPGLADTADDLGESNAPAPQRFGEQRRIINGHHAGSGAF